MLKKFVQIIGGDPNKKEIQSYSLIVEQINKLETEYEKLSDEALRAKTQNFRQRFIEGQTLDDLLVEAFAAVREASKRTLGLRHYDVQLIGGIVLHKSKIAEMRTGEGKTLVATLPLYLNAITGRGVHLVTVNDYLARRDARWMAPIYDLLGLSVGVLQMAARTENGKKAFIVDLSRSSPHEDQNQLRMVPRGEVYACDIVYGTNSEFGFDYLRDNMTFSLEERVQRGHYYAIIDEVDNILIDEARTPLIISGPAQDEAEWYIRIAQVIKQLRPEDYEVSEKNHTVHLTEIGESHVEDILGVPLRDPERPEDVTPEQARMLGYLEQGLRAQFLFKRNKDYLVQSGKVIIVDEFTGRLMPGRRWSDGLHQAIEAKEGVRVQSESVTYATITIQNYFRMYEKLAGMTGTAITESEEFDKIYKLGVLAIPTNLEYNAAKPESELVELEGRDEQGYRFHYYSLKNDPENKPVFWKRKDYPDVIYRTEEAKLRAIAREILSCYIIGRPVLVGTTSVELSERVSARLSARPLTRLVQIFLLRDTWMEHFNLPEDGRQIPELQFLHQSIESIDENLLRKRGRELGLSFNFEDPSNLERLVRILNLEGSDLSRLNTCLKGGIPHQVLNARKHTEESLIIARAGALGAVTIATNMAGRGVDIKLGGELREETLAIVNRILRRNGYPDPYNMTMQQRRQALENLGEDSFGIYQSQVAEFIEYLNQMEEVKKLGGLHVIGSERHEARRIDNQLRGRSARQGDPGSSRFYLSMQDYLMRVQGGDQANSLMQRFRIDDDFPLEVGLVGRLIEQAQTRMEGANFDVRKHLLEYDDVLNIQRETIYGQRDRIFEKEDLTEDVTEMLQTELSRRIPEALSDQDTPWRLLAWLEQIQPSFSTNGSVFPSFPLRILTNRLIGQLSSSPNAQEIHQALIEISRASILAEKQHLLLSVKNLLESAEDHFQEQLDEYQEILKNYLDNLNEDEEEDSPRRPQEILNELSNEVHIPFKLSPEGLRQLQEDPETVREELNHQLQTTLMRHAVTRLMGAVERRLNQPLSISSNHGWREEWSTLSETILSAIETIFDQRIERFLSPEGSIYKDLENALSRWENSSDNHLDLEQKLLQLLLLIPQGARASFDKRTHRRILERTIRLTFIYYIADLIANQSPTSLTQEITEHFEKAQETQRLYLGKLELARLGKATLMELEDSLRQKIQNTLPSTLGEFDLSQPISDLEDELQAIIIKELGSKALTEIYRKLLLRVISDLWVDYLTQMEALRISINLESYAQRDPLVQYKNRAFELFQNLLNNTRSGVVNSMFLYQPKGLSITSRIMKKEEAVEIPAETEANSPIVESSAESTPSITKGQPPNTSTARKRKRHKHR